MIWVMEVVVSQQPGNTVLKLAVSAPIVGVDGRVEKFLVALPDSAAAQPIQVGPGQFETALF